jgi:penicillin-binding protein 1A
VTLRDALAQSMNAAAARLHMTVGPRKTVAVARRLGIRSELRAEASLALGTSEVTLIELTGAYGVLANGGRALDPHLIRRVRTGPGRVLFERRDEPRTELVAPAHVAAMNDMLNAVLVSGTGKRAALPGHPAAGKTGTSQDFRDAWFVGYTERFVAGVWVGNDDGRAMNKVVGGSLPARLWHDVMLVAHEGGVPSAATQPARNGKLEPLMPRERIGSEFVDRAVGEDGNAASSPRAEPSARRGWVGTAKDLLRRGLDLVM